MDSKKENFVIVLPPPNVTGSLHLGHALTDAIQVLYITHFIKASLKLTSACNCLAYGVSALSSV